MNTSNIDWGRIPHTCMSDIQLGLYPTIKKFYREILNETNYVVDIGASNSEMESQAEEMIKNGSYALLFEFSDDKASGLKERHKDNNKVKVVNVKVTTDNILKLLEDNNVPDGFYLTIDIDGYEWYVIDKILEKYNPSYIISEINEKIPPPIRFTVKNNPDWFWEGSTFYGFSIQMVDHFIKDHGYSIRSLDYDNIVLKKLDKQIENINEHIKYHYENGYKNAGYDFKNGLKSNRYMRFPWNRDWEMLHDNEVSINTKKMFIKDKFKKYKGKYILK